MGKLSMRVSEKGIEMGELESGHAEHAGHVKLSTREGMDAGMAPRMWWREKRNIYYKTMISLSLFLVLLWQYGYPTFARTTILPPRQVVGVPQFVLDYAPLVYLDTQEPYFPSDIAAQVANTSPFLNLTSISNPPSPLTLDNLDSLNGFGDAGRNVYLTSNIDVRESPKWFEGVVPDSTGKTNGAISCAIITTDHGNDNVDAFYMYFYAYNMGNTVLFHELGDHIGDWEHNMIRFEAGKPKELWFSQHGNGQAYTYKAVEKIGLRPVSYSARGSHANYATPGLHDHTIPNLNLPSGLIIDFTSKGMLWDPTLSSYFYAYNANSTSFTGINGSPVAAMNYTGKWGDQQYPDDDPRQPDKFFGFAKYVSGPTGPYAKQLDREKTCPDNGILCIIRTRLGP